MYNVNNFTTICDDNVWKYTNLNSSHGQLIHTKIKLECVDHGLCFRCGLPFNAVLSKMPPLGSEALLTDRTGRIFCFDLFPFCDCQRLEKARISATCLGGRGL